MIINAQKFEFAHLLSVKKNLKKNLRNQSVALILQLIGCVFEGAI